jgi:hypothetical protein
LFIKEAEQCVGLVTHIVVVVNRLNKNRGNALTVGSLISTSKILNAGNVVQNCLKLFRQLQLCAYISGIYAPIHVKDI